MRTLRPLKPNTFRRPRGQKPVYLPNFTLTLLRTPHLPPTFASFITPLNINKLDLKDYLYHAYSIRVLSVRSYVQQQRVTQDKPGAKVPKARRWFRARSIKKMTVEMDGNGFVWPEEETDLEPWDRETYLAAHKANEKESERYGPHGDTLPKADSQTIAEQARALLDGREVWRPSWQDYGVAREVEVGVNVNAGLR